MGIILIKALIFLKFLNLVTPFLGFVVEAMAHLQWGHGFYIITKESFFSYVGGSPSASTSLQGVLQEPLYSTFV